MSTPKNAVTKAKVLEDTSAAILWLKDHSPGPWYLAAYPSNEFGAFTAAQTDAMRAWIAERNGRTNIYSHVNPLKGPPKNGKAKKTDVASCHWLWADLDAKDLVCEPTPEAFAAAKVETLKRLTAANLQAKGLPPPTKVVDSGGGYQPYWQLTEPVSQEQAEGMLRWIAQQIGGDPAVCEVSRIMRLPGTTNLPDDRKRAKGRTGPLPTGRIGGGTGKPVAPSLFQSIGKGKGKAAPVTIEARSLTELSELNEWMVPPLCQETIIRGYDPDEPNRWGGDRSKAVWHVVCELARCKVPDGLIYSIITDKAWAISAHVRDQGNPHTYALKQIADAKAQPVGEAGDLTDDGLALAIAAEWRDSARFVKSLNRWLFWSGARWKEDGKLEHVSRMRVFLRTVAKGIEERSRGKDAAEVETARKIAAGLRSAKKRMAVYSDLQGDQTLALAAAELDSDPWLLGTPGGTVDLRSGELSPSRPEDYLTKLTTVTPAPPRTKAPTWEKFLARIFEHDPELIEYMRLLLGYGLCGSVEEQIFAFAWGEGGNGKGTMFHSVSAILGDYACAAPLDMLLASQGDKHPTDLARLQGRRFVTASEVRPGASWDEAKLKMITGGDPIPARVMRGDFFEFQPTHFLCIFGQHRPSLHNVNEAMRRRLRLIPFTQNIPESERDPKLMEKLKAEYPAILRWLIDGCVEWQRLGRLPTPKSVQVCSDDYLSTEDVLGAWIQERCKRVSAATVTSGDLFRSWSTWAVENGHMPGSNKALSKKLRDQGFQKMDTTQAARFKGLRLKTAEETAKELEEQRKLEEQEQESEAATAQQEAPF